MQIYVHVDGKNFGPYTLDQLRQYVKAGNFRDDHLACHDGKNWIKIKDLPGLAAEAKQPKPAQKKVQQKTPKKKEKMRTKRLVIVSLGVLLFLSLIGLSIVGLANYLLSEDDEQTESAKAEVFALTPDQIVDIYDGDTFKVDLPSQHRYSATIYL